MIDPNATHRSQAILKLPKSSTGTIARAQAIVAAVTDNPHFPAPVPPLWLLSKAVTDLQKAEAAVRTGTKGTVAIRDERQTVVCSLLQQLRAYVQVIADSDPDDGVAIIESADMMVKKPSHMPPRVFSAKPGPQPGEVEIVAPSAGHRVAYDWEYSTDGGVNWLAIPSTLRASTTLVGLTPGTTVMLKYRSITRKGVSDWSAAITTLVK